MNKGVNIQLRKTHKTNFNCVHAMMSTKWTEFQCRWCFFFSHHFNSTKNHHIKVQKEMCQHPCEYCLSKNDRWSCLFHWNHIIFTINIIFSTHDDDNAFCMFLFSLVARSLMPNFAYYFVYLSRWTFRFRREKTKRFKLKSH